MKEYFFNSPIKGGKSIVTIYKDTLNISRPGMMAKMAMGFKGNKIIPIKNITSVQLKHSGFARGYIQFTIAGESAKNVGIINGQLDENIIYFDGKKYNKNADEIKNYIEKYNSDNTNQNIIIKEDKYDKLAKIKKLLDDSVITQEEFENEKNKILNS